MTRKCPVCGKDLEETFRDYIGDYLCELREGCPDGHYGEEFAFGSTTVVVGDWVIDKFPDDPESLRDLQEKTVLFAVAEAKRRLGS